jgi:uncharacterized membrane protein
MVGAGMLHFVIPGSYARIVPRVLGHARGLVAVTGAAELLAGALLAVPRTRRAGAWLTFGLLVGVWPANLQMALDGGIAGAAFPLSSATVAWARVPLQVPLLVWAWRQTRPTRADRAASADPVAGAWQGRR